MCQPHDLIQDLKCNINAPLFKVIGAVVSPANCISARDPDEDIVALVSDKTYYTVTLTPNQITHDGQKCKSDRLNVDIEILSLKNANSSVGVV
jgi:hypothetical protein